MRTASDRRQQETRTIPRTDGNRLLTVKELAVALNVSERFLYERTRRNEIPCYHLGAIVRFDLDEVRAWMRKRRTP